MTTTNDDNAKPKQPIDLNAVAAQLGLPLTYALEVMRREAARPKLSPARGKSGGKPEAS